MDKEENIPYYSNISEAFLKTRDMKTHPHLEILSYEEYTNRHIKELKPFRVNAYVIGVLTEGNCSFMIDEREYEFKRGSIYFLSPWHTRSYKIIQDWKGYMVAFTPHFLSNFSGGVDIANLAFFTPGKSVVLSLKEEELNELVALLKLMNTENKSDRDHKFQVLFHYIHIFLYKCEALLHETGTDTIVANNDVLVLFQQKVQSYFEQLSADRFSLPLTINDVADQMNLHPHYLSDIIKQKTGRTATQLIRERIAYEAQVLLKNTNKPIAEIAYHLGFEDNSNFTKFFKSQLQSTPKEYREKSMIRQGN